MDGKRIEVMKSLEGFVSDRIPELTLKEDEYWQPSDYLPDMSHPDACVQVQQLQENARGLSDDLMVVLIGNMITEEALPSYSMWITQVHGFDKNNEPHNSWGDWLRKWTAEENRHGDLLNKYLYLTGRVNMRAVEITIQNLLADGGDVGTGIDPYKTFTYTSFQEIATRISHANVAVQARKAGDALLTRICGRIAADEHRHAKAYKLFFSKCLELDPDGALLAFYDMMRQKITMPAMYMREKGKELGETFKYFANIAERSEIYTPKDYADILEHLLIDWDIEHLKGLGAKAEAAQEYLCSLPERYRKVAERFAGRGPQGDYTFSWLEMSASEPEPVPG
ncbi:MAG: acyl-ACP desaturase [Candidatus Hydrogenedentes bacterium]|nr:acyl-ACP desaturase [Candidatus Hydrogenedentota bacterium]